MNPLPDSFEVMMARKTFFWITVLFIALFASSMLTQLQFADFRTFRVDTVTLIRAGTLLFNVSVLILLSRPGGDSGFCLRLPSISTAVNFSSSLAASLIVAGNDVVSMGVYLVISLIYLMIFGFFIRNQLFTAGFGLLIICGAVVLFALLPDRLFHQQLESGQIRSAWMYVLFFGLVSTTILVTLNNQIYSMIISRTRESAERLRSIAFFDHSTGFPNGLLLEQDMKLFDETGELHPGTKLVMVGFRLEGLEALNETRGLAFTDALVREIALAYRLELRNQVELYPESVIPDPFKAMYRVESNTFVYILKLPGLGQNVLSTKSILASLIEKMVLEQQNRISLTFQGGFSVYPEDADTLAQLFRNLLNLLHSRRSESLGEFVSFNPEHYLEFLRQEQIRTSMRDALGNGEFHLVYQPKIEVADGLVKGFEALARWRSAVLGSVSPTEFIPLAEQTGAIERLTIVLLETAYRFIRTLLDENHTDITVSVNLSPGLLNTDFLDRIIADITENGLGASLELEITEGVLMKLNPLVSAKFGALKKLGVGFSIDDFGTGYSNLGYLQNFEADVLKIDKRFIDGIPLDVKNSKLVGAILQMARAFDMTVVAEGVEYREQRDFLLEHGCDQIQGYFYSKPLPPEEALAFLRRQG